MLIRCRAVMKCQAPMMPTVRSMEVWKRTMGPPTTLTKSKANPAPDRPARSATAPTMTAQTNTVNHGTATICAAKNLKTCHVFAASFFVRKLFIPAIIQEGFSDLAPRLAPMGKVSQTRSLGLELVVPIGLAVELPGIRFVAVGHLSQELGGEGPRRHDFRCVGAVSVG